MFDGYYKELFWTLGVMNTFISGKNKLSIPYDYTTSIRPFMYVHFLDIYKKCVGIYDNVSI